MLDLLSFAGEPAFHMQTSPISFVAKEIGDVCTQASHHPKRKDLEVVYEKGTAEFLLRRGPETSSFW